LATAVIRMDGHIDLRQECRFVRCAQRTGTQQRKGVRNACTGQKVSRFSLSLSLYETESIYVVRKTLYNLAYPGYVVAHLLLDV